MDAHAVEIALKLTVSVMGANVDISAPKKTKKSLPPNPKTLPK